MKILLIEPHPDDICLSMYNILKRQSLGKNEFCLLTVTNHKKETSEEFCKIMGLNYLGSLDTPDVDWKLRVNHNLIKKSLDPWRVMLFEYGLNFDPLELIPLNELRNVIEYNSIDKIIIPMGLLHPMHFLVRLVAGLLEIDRLYYADTPYQYRKYGEHLISTSELKLYKRLISSKEEVDEKINVFLKCYKSQRSIVMNTWNESKNFYDKGELLLK